MIDSHMVCHAKLNILDHKTPAHDASILMPWGVSWFLTALEM